MYQVELDQLKKRDVTFKIYKESVGNYLWNTEREIKKGLQDFINNFLDISEESSPQKTVKLARGLEKVIMDIFLVKPTEK